MKKHVVWLVYTAAVASCVSLAFYIDTTNPEMYTTQKEDFLHSKVGRFMSNRDKGTSDTDQCNTDHNQNYNCLIIPEISLTDNQVPIKRFGLTVTENSTQSQLTVCNPNAVHPCYERTDYCEQSFTFQPDIKEHTKRTWNLVFLFDGSGSVPAAGFHKTKEFIVDLMERLKNSSIKFAAVQFSTTYRKVFDFKDYDAGTAHDKLMKEPHLNALTNTHKALTYVLNEIFENPDSGASPDAVKVLVLITDGDPSDRDKKNIIKTYDEKNIIVLIIAVNGYFGDVSHRFLQRFNSKPENIFQIEDYYGLSAALENLSNTIKEHKETIEGNNKFSAVSYKICSPGVIHECNETFSLNTVCHKITDTTQVFSFTAALQDCTKKKMDLVFLFDGSGSMTGDEFNKNKDFIVDIMEHLKKTSIKFAAVQFSTTYRKVFDFKDYDAGTAHDKLMKEQHLNKLTNTHRALTYVLNEIFENPDSGASPDAVKVLVLITDGDPSDQDRKNIIKTYDEKNIIRFVIGVKDANIERFQKIASQPENAFKIEEYNGLTGILRDLITNICQVEVTALAGKLEYEEAQSGFSAVFHKDTMTLSPLGSNSWRSFLQQHPPTQTADPETKMAPYWGNSVFIGQRRSVPLYFTGAPRFELTGQVVLFTHNQKNWTVSQRITGEQIGSHFGAELCLLDVTLDGDTDFLFVGAPLFHLPSENKQGQIYVYALTDELQLKSVLNVTAPSTGRFGTSISSLKDLNGDGLRDVAVGAPFEDNNRGVVYIYLGDRDRGIRSTFSQRIMGQQIKPMIRFFGQAIDWDSEKDGIVVGSQDTAVILRSNPEAAGP